MRTELEELWREQQTSWGAAHVIRCAQGHPGSQCMGPPIPRAPSRSPEAAPPPPDVTSLSQPAGSLRHVTQPTLYPLPSSPSCPSGSVLHSAAKAVFQNSEFRSESLPPRLVNPSRLLGLERPKRTVFPPPSPPQVQSS